MNYGICIKSRPSPLIWCPDSGTSPETCTAEDIDLVTGLLSWWQLIDVGALDFEDQGPANNPVLFDGPLYEFDGGRLPAEGAAEFYTNPNAFAEIQDASGIYIDGDNPFTIGLWLRLDDKGASVTILSYVSGIAPGLVTQYELIYDDGLDRLVWSVQGVSGTAVVLALTLGSPTVGQWYWVELSYDPDTECASIRVAPDRTDALEALTIDEDVAPVPGGLAEVPGRLFLGISGADSIAFGAFLEGFDGAMIGVGFWTKLLSNCERGFVNQPEDYPWARRLTPEEDYRIDADGRERIYEE